MAHTLLESRCFICARQKGNNCRKTSYTAHCCRQSVVGGSSRLSSFWAKQGTIETVMLHSRRVAGSCALFEQRGRLQCLIVGTSCDAYSRTVANLCYCSESSLRRHTGLRAMMIHYNSVQTLYLHPYLTLCVAHHFLCRLYGFILLGLQ